MGYTCSLLHVFLVPLVIHEKLTSLKSLSPSASHKSSSSPKKTRLGHGATSNYHNGKKKSSKTNRSEAKILGSPTKHSLKSQSSDSENESTPESVESDHDDVAKTLPPATAHTPYEVRLKVKSRTLKHFVFQP